MSEKDPNGWMAVLDAAPQLPAAAMSFIVAFFRVAYQGGKWRTRMLEATLCALMTVASSSLVAAANGIFNWHVPAEAVVAIGAWLAFIGVDEIREIAMRYLGKKSRRG